MARYATLAKDVVSLSGALCGLALLIFANGVNDALPVAQHLKQIETHGFYTLGISSGKGINETRLTLFDDFRELVAPSLIATIFFVAGDWRLCITHM